MLLSTMKIRKNTTNQTLWTNNDHIWIRLIDEQRRHIKIAKVGTNGLVICAPEAQNI